MQNRTRIFAFIGSPLRVALASLLIFIPISISSAAQDAVQGTENPAVATTPVIPQQVRYAGTLAARTGETVEAEFRIYAAAEGGDPLWTEMQRVTVGEDGSYSVLLGFASPSGLPQKVFAGGAARWLGVSVERSTEQERVLLSSVPYAMKSADAESLSGHAASDFVTQEQLAQLAQAALQPAQNSAATPDAQPNTSPTVTGSGTTNTVPLWTSTETQGNSIITQAGSDIGINEPTPSATLDVNGTANIRGALTVAPIATATTTAGQNSQHLNLTAEAWSTATKSASPQTFDWVAAAEGNNTANPSGALYLQFQSGTTARTNLFDIDSTGVFHWAPSQTFPGTIGSVTATSPVTATTASGAVSLGLNQGALVTAITPALESSLNGVYAQLGTTNTFQYEVYAQQATGTGYGAFVGIGTNGSIGTYGRSDTGYGAEGDTTSGSGVYGFSNGTGYGGYFINNTTSNPALFAENDATGNPGNGIAVKGYVPSASSIGVLGEAASDTSYGVFGEDLGGTDSYGVYASTTGTGSTAVYGISTGGADANNVTGSGVVGISSTGNGVQGSSQGASKTGAGLAPYGSWGVWGDFGSPGTAPLGAAILGTADTYAAAFLRNNGQNATLVANNSGAGQAASFSGYTTYQDSPTVTVQNNSTGGAGEMVNYSNNAVTLYLSNNGSGSIIDARRKVSAPATDALFKTLMASTPTGTCGIGGNGDLSCTGQMKSLVSTNDGARKVETYAPQSAENWMEDYGTGVMERGVSVVKIDPAFAETISQSADYHVFITPRADSKGLYVINATLASFEVRESGGGTSSLSFDYKVVAKRRGYEAQRLTDVTDRYTTEVERAISIKAKQANDKKLLETKLNAPKPHLTSRAASAIQP